jgi:23S rRNA pseudouridine1911/1915/1917 synthase
VSNSRRIELTAPPAEELHGGDLVRLDRWLSERLPETSRSVASRWIRDGLVRMNDKVVTKPGTALLADAAIVIETPAAPEHAPQPESIEIPILFEDDAILVIDKPIALVVHPGHGVPDGTLVNAILGMGRPLAAAGGTMRPGIVHRLDRETSGALVLAKSDAAYRKLSGHFAERRVRKIYQAIVWGRPEPDSGTIDRGIGRSRQNPTKMAVSGTRGARRHALSTYRTLEAVPGFAHLEVGIETGRTHQIRVHLQSINHPVVGDHRYGGRAWRGLQDTLKRAAVRRFEGLALHAHELAFPHPISGETVTFRAPIPARMTELMKVLRVPVK